MDLIRKIGLIPLAIVFIFLFFVIFVRVHHPHVATPKPAGSLLSYQAQTPVPATAAAAPPIADCMGQAQYTHILDDAKRRNGLQLSGTGVTQDGRRLEIYQTVTTANFTIFAIGADPAGQYQACPLVSGKDLQLQPAGVSPPQTVPAPAPR